MYDYECLLDLIRKCFICSSQFTRAVLFSAYPDINLFLGNLLSSFLKNSFLCLFAVAYHGDAFSFWLYIYHYMVNGNTSFTKLHPSQNLYMLSITVNGWLLTCVKHKAYFIEDRFENLVCILPRNKVIFRSRLAL